MATHSSILIWEIPHTEEPGIKHNLIPLEKEMATHSSILIWEIPHTEEQGIKHNLMTEHACIINTIIYIFSTLFVLLNEKLLSIFNRK